MASDACGNTAIAQQSITVTDTNAPVVLIQPSPAIALVDSHVFLAVTAAGTSPLNFQWLFDDSPVPGATDSTLVLSNFSEAQCGNYSVVVTNQYGAVTSSSSVAECYYMQLSQGAVEFTFSGSPGRQYGLEFRNGFDQPWQGFTNITLATDHGTIQDTIADPETQRFYRVFMSQ
jgi:hypothetical protein